MTNMLFVSVLYATKSKVTHFRTKSVEKSKEVFQCGETIIKFIHQYKYLGLIISEHLDMLVMVKMMAQSASRALGLLIAKDKALGGMPYQCFSKCYDAIVQSTLNYGAQLYMVLLHFLVLTQYRTECVDIFLDMASMHPILPLMVIWVGLCHCKNSGFVLLGTDAN